MSDRNDLVFSLSMRTAPEVFLGTSRAFVVQTKLGGEKEVVCLAMKHDLIAVGSQRQVTLLDPRLKRPGLDIKNVERADGKQSRPHSSKWFNKVANH